MARQPTSSRSPDTARSPRPVLLVFTLGPAADQRRRHLLAVGSETLERSLYRCCLEETLAAGRAAGCELVVAAPATLDLPADARRLRQTGTGFGERLRRAVAAAAVPGRPLLVVGTDTPGVDSALLRTALGALAHDPATAVVGPAPDGGFYLLAADPGIVELDAVLTDVAWRTSRALTGLRRSLARRDVAVTLLAPRGDLDRRGDLERWLGDGIRAARRGIEHRLWRPLVRRLLAVLAARRRPRPALVPVPRRPPRARLFRGRAPPPTSATR